MASDGIEVIILPDGRMLVPRGTREENEMSTQVFEDICDFDNIKHFFGLTDDSEIIQGHDHPLCG